MANKFETTRQYNWAGGIKLTTSATSAATGSALGWPEIVVFATADSWITMGVSPTAVANTAGNMLIKAGEKFHLQIDPTHKLAAIQDTAAGAVHIIPVS